MPWMHCSHMLIVQPWDPPLCLDVPTFTARCLHVLHDARDPSSERWNFVGENDPVILPKCRFPRYIWESFICRKSTTWDGRLCFPPKEGALRIFCPWKSEWLRPGLNLQTWVLKGNVLPLDHRSHCRKYWYWSRIGTYAVFPEFHVVVFPLVVLSAHPKNRVTRFTVVPCPWVSCIALCSARLKRVADKASPWLRMFETASFSSNCQACLGCHSSQVIRVVNINQYFQKPVCN